MRFLAGLCLGLLVAGTCPYVHGHINHGVHSAVVGVRGWLADLDAADKITRKK